jgi:hypothetical protein
VLQINANDLPNWQALVFFVGLIGLWAALRPTMIRDYDSRRLPTNPTARTLFIALFVAIYAAMVIAFHYSGELAIKIGKSLPLIGDLNETFRDQAPLLAAFTLGAVMQLQIFRDVERSVVVWLHSASHLHGDREALTEHLLTNEFVSSEEEQRAYTEALAKYGIYITDAPDSVGPVTFKNWRKLTTLLRLLRTWNDEDKRVLTRDDMRLLSEIENAHDRKTQLAITIVKMVERVEQGKSPNESLPELLTMLTEVGHLDREAVARVETTLRDHLAEGSQSSGQGSLHLTGKDFANHLRQIEGYFQIEYETLVQQAADLTAKSVILSGGQASGRLEQLKKLGFVGLGRIEPVDLDRILWLFLVVACGGFLVLFLGNVGEKYSPIGWDALARFSFIMTVAALIGAIVGSSRRLSSVPSTPWGKYIAAGVLAAVAFFAIQAVSALIKNYQGIEGSDRFVFSVYRTLPWMVLPFFLTIAISRLGRMPAWPILPGLGRYPNATERILDGLAISIVIYVAYALTIAIHVPFDLPWSKRLATAMLKTHFLPVPVRWPLQVMGFLIGFFVVRDVRRAAHAKIVATGNGDDARETAGATETGWVVAGEGSMFRPLKAAHASVPDSNLETTGTASWCRAEPGGKIAVGIG